MPRTAPAPALLYRPAAEADIPAAAAILRQGAERMLAEGKRQWTATYPSSSDVARDVARGAAHVLEQEGRVVAYGAVIADGEPAYDHLEGRWITSGPYIVVHRLGVRLDCQRGGLARAFFEAVTQQARRQGMASLRVDTNFDNDRMLALLRRLGFAPCGEVRYPQGPRLAFELSL